MALKGVWERTSFVDRTIVLALFLAAVGGCLAAGFGERGERVVVERRGKVIYTAPLEGERTAGLKGALGETLLSIAEGHARIVSSPCPHKICLGMGKIRHQGEVIACIPNGLLVRIAGGQPPESKNYDLLSR